MSIYQHPIPHPGPDHYLRHPPALYGRFCSRDHYNRLRFNDSSGKPISPPAQNYTFRKTVRFSPTGQADITTIPATRPLTTRGEIGIRPTHGVSCRQLQPEHRRRPVHRAGRQCENLPPMKQRVARPHFLCRSHSRARYRCLLFDYRFQFGACRRADESQRDFSNRSYEHHRLRDRGYAGDNIFNIPAICHHVRHCENIVLRWHRTIYNIVRCEFAVSRKHNVSFEPVGLSYADLKVTWPAPVILQQHTQRLDRNFAAFDRN